MPTRGPKEPARTRASRPAATTEARENQIVALALDVAEQQLRSGQASSQVITHFLKMGSEREKLERDRLQRENELLSAKVEAMASSTRMEELYAKAIDAMREYSGNGPIEEYDYDEG